MKYKDFENQLGKSFYNDSVAIDTDSLIASLNLPITQKKDDRFPYWVATSIVLILAMITGAFYLNSSNSAVDSSAIVTSSMVQFPTDNSALLVDNKEEEHLEEEITNEPKNASNKVITESSSKISTSAISALADVDTNPTAELNRSEITEEKNLPVFNKNTQESKQISRSIKTTEVVNIPSENNSNNSLNLASLETPTSKIKNNSIAKPSIEIASIGKIESVMISNEDRLAGLGEPQCPSFSTRSPWNFSLLAELGLMKPSKELTNSSDMPSPTFGVRKEGESSKEAIQLGLYAKVSRKDTPFYLRGGAAYTRIAEQMTEDYNYIERDTTVGLISITTSMTGDTITSIFGDIVTETTFSGTSQKHYYLHLWDLPIAIGYEAPLADGFYLGGEVGVQFNIKTGGSGLIFRDVNDYANLSEVVSSETSVGLSYFGGVHIGKHLTDRSSIQFSARFRYYSDTFSTIESNVQQKYSLAGLHAGYLYHF